MTTQVDLEAVKQRQQVNWSAGDYAVIGTTLQLIGESLCETLDLSAGSRVLDLAAGNGNASLAAARRGCDVTAVDYVPELLHHLKERAAADGLVVDTVVGDAEAVELPDASFDAVVSTLGVMFTANQERAAGELLRLCRPGGRIGLANWTPGGFVGQMFKVIGGFVPPPAGVRSPMEWGTEGRLRELLGDGTSSLTITEKHHVFRYRSPREFVETFRAYYGPMVKAYEALDEAGRAGLTDALVALLEQSCTATDGTLRVPSAYVEVIAVRT